MFPCEISGSHRGVIEDRNLRGCDAVPLGELFKTFRRIVLPSFLGRSSPRVQHFETSGYALRHSITSQRTCIFVLFQLEMPFKENEVDFNECHPVLIIL